MHCLATRVPLYVYTIVKYTYIKRHICVRLKSQNSEIIETILKTFSQILFYSRSLECYGLFLISLSHHHLIIIIIIIFR